MATPKLEAQAGKLNIVIEQGATFNPVLTYTDSAEPPVPINLTGYTARMQIRLKRTSSGFLHELTTENGGITLGGAAGTIILLITSGDTTAFTFTSAVYDLELIDGSAVVTRLLQGSVALSTEATK
jgi:hypothetical protein